MIEIKICKQCKKVITAEGRNLFCSAECQTIFYSKDKKEEVEIVVKKVSKAKEKSLKVKEREAKLLHRINKAKEKEAKLLNRINKAKEREAKLLDKINKAKGIDTREHKEQFKKVCINCDKEFETVYQTQLYCSAKCVSEYRRKEYQKDKERNVSEENTFSYKRLCKNCGKEFETNLENMLCCSDQCAKEFNI